MLTNSGLAALAVTVRGSSAMPQIGQAAWPVAHDLRMHGAGVFGVLGWGRVAGLAQAPFRISGKRLALRRALRDAWGRCIAQTPRSGAVAMRWERRASRRICPDQPRTLSCSPGSRSTRCGLRARPMPQPFPVALSCRIPDRSLSPPHLLHLPPVTPPVMVRVSTGLLTILAGKKCAKSAISATSLREVELGAL